MLAERGDAAVAHYNKLFDGIEKPIKAALRFDAGDCRAAFERIEQSLQKALSLPASASQPINNDSCRRALAKT